MRDLFRRGHLELEEAIQALGVLTWVGGSSSCYKLVDVLVVLFTSPPSVDALKNIFLETLSYIIHCVIHLLS